ncbi:MAG TPA: ABC transporter permease [Blastocatellia bacterium]|nr:ABC transporter permease [Blastocatellia bacterium]
MGALWQDINYGVRMLAKSPGTTFIAVLALALGIGANTAIFSVVNALLLDSLPFKDSDRLIMVWEHNYPRSRQQNTISPANFLDWKDQSNSFEDMALFFDSNFNLTGDGEPEEITGQWSSPNFFSILGVEPIKGRHFTAEDARSEGEFAIVISHGIWQRRFGGDPEIIGKKIALSQRPATVIGVLPADFDWYIKRGSRTGNRPEFFMPLNLTDDFRVRRGRFARSIGRLKPGVTLEQSQAELSTIASRLEDQHKDFNTGWGVQLVPLREQFVGDIRTALLVLLGAVGLVLLIACANVANLQLARATTRQKEMAIRTALGAGRGRVIRQLLTESVLLSGIGGVCGLLLALWGVDLLIALSPENLPSLSRVGVNLPVLGFTLVVSLLTGIIFGMAPALEAGKQNPNESLKELGRGTTASGRSRLMRKGFVVAQVALALVLLVSAGLLMKSFLRLQAVSPGFDVNNILTMRVTLPIAKYPEPAQRTAFFKQAVERLEALPGVESVGAISFLPFTGPGAATDFTIVGQPVPAPGDEMVTDVRVTDSNFFRAMNIPILRGRTFTEQEATEERRVVVISEALARLYFPGEDPIGKRIIVQMKEENLPTEIIGVVGDIKHQNLEDEVRGMVYWPYPELPYTSMTLVAKTQADPLNFVASMQREIQSLDKDQPVADVRTMEQWLARTIAQARFNTLLLGVFAVVALVLAAVGIYGVMAYTVTQQTHEIGIRMAFGAQPSHVLRMVVSQGGVLVLIGVAAGLATSFTLTRLLSSLLFGVSPTDPVMFSFIPIVLLMVAMLACIIPARRAVKVDPMVALRYE